MANELRPSTAEPPPHDIAAWHLYASAATGSANWKLATLRWEQVRNRFPDDPTGYWRSIQSLHRDGKIADAEALGISSMERFPESAPIALEFAWCAEARKDWPDVVRRCEQVRLRFPDNPMGAALGILALLRLGRGDDAEALAATAMAQFPENRSILVQWAAAATWRREWPEALRRWMVAKSLCPPSQEIENSIGQIQAEMQLERLDNVALGAAPDTIPAAAAPASADSIPDAAGPAEMSLPELFRQFESLGDNCEFGQMQRMAGIEPLGLLRWAGITARQLVAALEQRFDGVGLPENTQLILNQHNEYLLTDRRFFQMHTFIRFGQADPEKLRPQMCRRSVFLKSKLLEDLHDGERIFVYKRGTGDLSDAEMAAISKALRSYGNNVLLCVRKPTGAQQDRTVEWVAKDLMVGYIADLQPDVLKAPTYASSWTAICRAAYRLARPTATSTDP